MEKVWLASYPEGVPELIPDPPYSSLTDMMNASMKKYASRKAYTNMGSSITFGELDELSNRFAHYLLYELNLKKGDRVAIMLPNVNQYPIALCWILKAGLVVVNVNPLYTPRELKHQLSDSRAKTIIILENFANVLSEVIHETSIEKVILTKMGDMLSFPKNHIVNFVVKHIKKLVPPYEFSDSSSFLEILSKNKNSKLEKIDIDIEDIAFLQYFYGGTDTGLNRAMGQHHAFRPTTGAGSVNKTAGIVAVNCINMLVQIGKGRGFCHNIRPLVNGNGGWHRHSIIGVHNDHHAYLRCPRCSQCQPTGQQAT